MTARLQDEIAMKFSMDICAALSTVHYDFIDSLPLIFLLL